jgi:DNA-binding IclR family transcriptional regulator
MWESRVLCETSKRLWKSFCDFHSRAISTAVFGAGANVHAAILKLDPGRAIGSAAIGEVTQRTPATIPDSQLFAEWVTWAEEIRHAVNNLAVRLVLRCIVGPVADSQTEIPVPYGLGVAFARH